MAYIGIDVGTSGCKAAVLDRDGVVVASASRQYAFISPRPGWAEMDPEAMWRAVVEVLAELAPKAGGVRSLAVASIGESMVMTDAGDRVLYNAVNYVDSRCCDTIGLIEPVIPLRELHARTGMQVNPMYSLNKLLWFRENMPEVLDATRKIFLFVEYFGYRLTGERLVDPAVASRTQLMDMRSLDWSPDLMERFGVDGRLFSRIGRPGDAVGKLLPEVAAATGLSPDVEVVLGTHDQACGTLGSGTMDAGDCLLGEGSSEGMNLVVDGEHITDALFDAGISVEPFFDGRYFATAGLLTHGTSIRWFVEMFARELEAERGDPGESLYAVADRVCAEDSARVYFLPYMSGVDANDAENNARGCFVGLDVTVTMRQMYRALLEGLCFETRSRMEKLFCGGVRRGKVTAAGGASKSALYMQMKADVLGRPVGLLRNEEAGITGLGMICAVARGDFADYAEAAKVFVRMRGEHRPARDYSRRFEEYRVVVRHMRALYRELG